MTTAPETEMVEPTYALVEDLVVATGSFAKGHTFHIVFQSPDRAFSYVRDAEPVEGQPTEQLYIETRLLAGAPIGPVVAGPESGDH